MPRWSRSRRWGAGVAARLTEHYGARSACRRTSEYCEYPSSRLRVPRAPADETAVRRARSSAVGPGCSRLNAIVRTVVAEAPAAYDDAGASPDLSARNGILTRGRGSWNGSAASSRRLSDLRWSSLRSSLGDVASAGRRPDGPSKGLGRYPKRYASQSNRRSGVACCAV